MGVVGWSWMVPRIMDQVPRAGTCHGPLSPLRLVRICKENPFTSGKATTS